jgi:hypothetical protein
MLSRTYRGRGFLDKPRLELCQLLDVLNSLLDIPDLI